MREQTCTSCEQSLPLSAFDLDRRTRTGHRAMCKECRSRKRKEAAVPIEQVQETAVRTALVALVKRHRTEFDRLTMAEMLRMGAGEEELPEWALVSVEI